MIPYHQIIKIKFIKLVCMNEFYGNVILQPLIQYSIQYTVQCTAFCSENCELFLHCRAGRSMMVQYGEVCVWALDLEKTKSLSEKTELDEILGDIETSESSEEHAHQIHFADWVRVSQSNIV